MAEQQYDRTGKVWYVSDDLIWDSLDGTLNRPGGGPRECSSHLSIYNPGQHPAALKLKFFLPHRDPTEMPMRIAPRRIEQVDLSALPIIPHKRAYWIGIESDQPVLPQLRHEDYTFWDPVPDAMTSVSPYPGPLHDEVSWVFPDCYQGYAGSWYERETLTILNPGDKSVKAHVRYVFRQREGAGEETVEIPAGRVAQLNVWERMPTLIGAARPAVVQVSGDYAVRIDATHPVLAQSTRRARWVGYEPIIGSRSTMGIPLRPSSDDLWYYPAGDIVDKGILPRSRPGQPPWSQCDNAWNLLFINNLSADHPVQARVTFHQSTGQTIERTGLAINPLKSINNWLHDPAEWLGKYVQVNQPFAMTVQADSPVAAEVCGAEFENWSQVCPGAMSAVNLYRGPLTNETSWWLGIGETGGHDDRNVEWTRSYYLFNPGQHHANVTLRFMTSDTEIPAQITIAPASVQRLDASDVPGLQAGLNYVTRADSDRPICAQVTVRAMTRGQAATRSMYSMIGTPMRLDD